MGSNEMERLKAEVDVKPSRLDLVISCSNTDGNQRVQYLHLVCAFVPKTIIHSDILLMLE